MKVATINYALGISPTVVLDTVTISDGASAPITVPAGKTLKIVGAVTTSSQDILVDATAGRLDAELSTTLGDAADVYLVTKANAAEITSAQKGNATVAPKVELAEFDGESSGTFAVQDVSVDSTGNIVGTSVV
ncbi:hypothetical protein FACS189468_5810 [Spirochaetia bacterium]|nr:hypothetical protein FACS189468_5810 [Spirochaetia bacterium]